MQTLLLFLIILLTIVICALAGFWFFRPDPVYKPKARVAKVTPRVTQRVRWTTTGRPFRDTA